VLAGSDAWVCVNVTSGSLPLFAEAAAKAKLRRVVFAVNVSGSGEEQGEGVGFKESCDLLREAGVSFTILKHGAVRAMAEGKYPYRIVREALPLPTLSAANSVSGTFDLSSEDLFRVLVEAIDIPKTFDKVFGIGPGSSLDSEILVYMKSQGWPERVQVGMHVGDLKESIEKKFELERKSQMIKAGAPIADAPSKPLGLPLEGQAQTKYAGFFSG
jgi:hypothetical protein